MATTPAVSTSSAGSLAARKLTRIFPDIGPWTEAALWHGLSDNVPMAPASPLDDELVHICSQRLGGLLLRYVRAAHVTLTSEQVTTLRAAAFRWTEASMSAVRASEPALTVLHDAQIDAVITKGPGIARFYPAPDCRPFSDLDLLMEPSQFVTAASQLEDCGWYEEIRNRQPWRYFRRWCREGLNLRDDRGGSVDLHHRVPPWLWSGGLDTQELVDRSEVVTSFGRQLRCLSAVDNLLVVALHLVSDRNAPGRSLIVWRDLVQLAQQVPPHEAATAAERAGLAGWLAAVLRALPAAMGTEALLAALPSQRLPHSVRLRLLLGPGADRFGVLLTQVLRLPTLNGLAFAVGMLLPSRTFLRVKYPDEVHLYRRWWSNVRPRLGLRNAGQVRDATGG